MLGEDRDADAQVDVDRLLVDAEGLVDRLQDLLGDQRGPRYIGRAPGQHREFVAAVAGDGIGFPQHGPHALAHLLEQAIARLVAEAVVDALEAIEVHQQYGAGLHLALARPDGLFQPLAKEGSVWQPCQRIVQRTILERLGLGLALGYVAQAADHQPLQPEAADVEFEREARTILAQPGGFVASHQHFALLWTQVGTQLRLDLGPVGFGDQPRKILSDDFIGGIAKESFGRRVVGADRQPLIDREDAVGDVVEDRPDPVAAVAELLFRPAPLDELTDLTADVAHGPERDPIERAPLRTEERDHAGDLPPIGDGEGELAVEAGARGQRGAGRFVTSDVLDRSRPAGGPYPTQEPDAPRKCQLAAGRLEAGEVLQRTVPADLEAQQVGVPVHCPEFAGDPAQGFADALQHLGRGFGPGRGIGQGPRHGELHVAQTFRRPSLADVGDEGDEGDPRTGARGGRDGELDRKFAAVAMERGEFDGAADQLALTGFDKARQPSLVRVLIAARDDRAGQRSPDGLIVRPAEDRLCLAVPTGDHAALVRGDHGAGRGVDDHLQPLLRFPELLHHPQLHLGLPPGGVVHPDGRGEQCGAGEEEQRMPDIPEAVVAGPGEEEDHCLDRDQHQADQHAALDSPVGIAAVPVEGGGQGDRDKRRCGQQRVELGESTCHDQGRQREGQAAGDGDAQGAETGGRAKGTRERAPRIGERSGPLQQDPGQ